MIPDKVLCDKTDCLNYGDRNICYTTNKQEQAGCKVYFKHSDLKKINKRDKTRRLEAQL